MGFSPQRWPLLRRVLGVPAELLQGKNLREQHLDLGEGFIFWLEESARGSRDAQGGEAAHQALFNVLSRLEREVTLELLREGFPVIKDGNVVVFETSDESQVIAKYVDSKLKLNLFPRPLDGVQSIIWRFIETEVENITFKLNDIYYEEFVPEKYRLDFIRFKERKYGTGCIQNWRINQIQLVRDLIKALLPFERMVTYRDYLLCEQPVFVDFDLLGMIENFLFSGHYHFPNELPNLADWYNRLKSLRYGTLTNEK